MITNDICYIGVNDHETDLFEGQYSIPNGIAYNSYLILDDKIAIMDTVDRKKCPEFMANLEKALKGRKPDYMIVQHVEPDHASSLKAVMDKYPGVKIVTSAGALKMLPNYFDIDFRNAVVVKDGEELCLGQHTLTFVAAPMVHWPEVIMTYDKKDKVLFSADAFGKFGALDVDEDWDCEARRYYFNIVGKFGPQVQAVLKKAEGLEIKTICPLHGPVLTDTIGHVLEKYKIWSTYDVESEGVFIAYVSMHGNTAQAANKLAEILREKCCVKVAITDLAREDSAEALEDAFRYGRIVLAAPSYNGGVMPVMADFLHHLILKNYQNRQVALIENGSWAPSGARTMRASLDEMKDITVIEPAVTIRGALKDSDVEILKELADKLLDNASCQVQCPSGEDTAESITAEKEEKPKREGAIDKKALYSLSYGVFALSTKSGEKANACITNTCIQVANDPVRLGICVLNTNYTCDLIKESGVFAVSLLDQTCQFETIKHFGMQSGRDVDKFADMDLPLDINGVPYLSWQTCAVLSCKVAESVNLGSHTMFIGELQEAKYLSEHAPLTYADYQNNVKPKPAAQMPAGGKKIVGWKCQICNYVYEGSELPDDYLCPLCGHDKSDFAPIYE